MKQPDWKAEFKNPSETYRAKPFWSWNGRLDKAALEQQMHTFKQMGYGGFHIHSRVGLADEYLGPRFMDCVQWCNAAGRALGLETWLYDEDKWPSGYGGGFVTRDPANRNRCLMLSQRRYPDGYAVTGRKQTSRLTENGTATLLAAYAVSLDGEGYLLDYRRCEPGGTEANWFAYEIVTQKLAWFNEQAYADLLNPETTRALLDRVYERYRGAVGGEFGKSILAMFTDEPQHSKAHTLKNALGDEEPVLPYTPALDGDFAKAYGYSLLDRLPEVIWNGRDLVSRVRWQFHDRVTERFAEAYFAVIREWCRQNGLMLTGHVMREDTLLGQTECVGETMRLYERFDLPGLDILADRHEYTTAKQVQSVCRQCGKAGVTAEVFGVTNWDFGFSGHKLQMDWLMALGVTVRVPHLAWMTMGGESKRDYPAALDGHAPWHGCYKPLEDYFARVCALMSRGRSMVRVAVVHPIESYWALYGPDDQTARARRRLEEQFAQITEWLLFNQIDFDFLSEALLDTQPIRSEKGVTRVGEMHYEAIIVPPLITLRGNTLELLQRHREAGGAVICMGDPPRFVEGAPCDVTLPEGSARIGFDLYALLDALEPLRDIRLMNGSGQPQRQLLYQMREEGDARWLFIAQGRSREVPDERRRDPGDRTLHIGIRGMFIPELCDAMRGEILPLRARYDGDWTWTSAELHEQDSFLMRLTPGRQEAIEEPEAFILSAPEYFTDLVPYVLSEPNVLLLDQPEYSLDGEPWRPREEILRVDDRLRERCGYAKRTDAFPQPWLSGGRSIAEHTVRLRWRFGSELEGVPVKIAWEPDCAMLWNGREVSLENVGTYLDDAIRCASLGELAKGENELILEIPFGPKTNLEACYLLGNFGVRVCGVDAVIMALPEKLGFGDLCAQGLPFYGGNVAYRLAFDCAREEELVLTLPRFSAPAVDAALDGKHTGTLFMEPFRLALGRVDPGQHTLELTCLGSRINQFGQLHNCARGSVYYGPFSWRTIGDEWSPAYQLKPTGILASPYIQCLNMP